MAVQDTSSIVMQIFVTFNIVSLSKSLTLSLSFLVCEMGTIILPSHKIALSLKTYSPVVSIALDT